MPQYVGNGADFSNTQCWNSFAQSYFLSVGTEFMVLNLRKNMEKLVWVNGFLTRSKFNCSRNGLKPVYPKYFLHGLKPVYPTKKRANHLKCSFFTVFILDKRNF
jgi:hypothetical protein